MNIVDWRKNLELKNQCKVRFFIFNFNLEFAINQMEHFFNAWEKELRKCRAHYFTWLKDRYRSFEEDFKYLEHTVEDILKQATEDTYDQNVIDHNTPFKLYVEINKSLQRVAKYTNALIDKCEPWETEDFIFSFNRSDLKNRIETLIK